MLELNKTPEGQRRARPMSYPPSTLPPRVTTRQVRLPLESLAEVHESGPESPGGTAPHAPRTSLDQLKTRHRANALAGANGDTTQGPTRPGHTYNGANGHHAEGRGGLRGGDRPRGRAATTGTSPGVRFAALPRQRSDGSTFGSESRVSRTPRARKGRRHSTAVGGTRPNVSAGLNRTISASRTNTRWGALRRRRSEVASLQRGPIPQLRMRIRVLGRHIQQLHEQLVAIGGEQGRLSQLVAMESSLTAGAENSVRLAWEEVIVAVRTTPMEDLCDGFRKGVERAVRRKMESSCGQVVKREQARLEALQQELDKLQEQAALSWRARLYQSVRAFTGEAVGAMGNCARRVCPWCCRRKNSDAPGAAGDDSLGGGSAASGSGSDSDNDEDGGDHTERHKRRHRSGHRNRRSGARRPRSKSRHRHRASSSRSRRPPHRGRGSPESRQQGRRRKHG